VNQALYGLIKFKKSRDQPDDQSSHGETDLSPSQMDREALEKYCSPKKLGETSDEMTGRLSPNHPRLAMNAHQSSLKFHKSQIRIN
jgi:hypothetical protein